MHRRLKFRHHLIAKKLTHRDRGSGALVDPGARDRTFSREVLDAWWREKAKIRCPYRKPTQVGEEGILRPTGEGLLRNSAKCVRNFGRRIAHSDMGRSEEGQATVYQKHRSLLNRKMTYRG